MRSLFFLFLFLTACIDENVNKNKIIYGPHSFIVISCNNVSFFGRCELPYRQLLPLEYTCGTFTIKEIPNTFECVTQTLFEEEFINSTFNYNGKILKTEWTEVPHKFNIFNGRRQKEYKLKIIFD